MVLPAYELRRRELIETASCVLSLGETLEAFVQTELLDELRAPYTVLWLGGELGITAVVEIERDDFGESVAADVQRFPLLQALEEV